MEGERDTGNRKVKMKKRKMEDDALHAHSVIKKKKTAEKKEEKEAVINIVYKKRRRKERENHCIEIDESDTGTNQGMANRQRKEIEHDELKPNKRKKKKRKYKEEAEEYIATDSPVPRKKQKKKKKKNEKAEVEETPESSFEHSFSHISSTSEKRGEREERIEEENLPFITQHVFLKPLPVPEKKREKRDKPNSNIYRGSQKETRKDDIEEGKQEKSNIYKSKRRKGMEERGKEKEGKPKSSSKQKIPGEKSDEDQNTSEQEHGRTIKELSYTKWKTAEEDKLEQQSQSTSDKQKVVTRKTKPPGITSRLAYNGLHGWETDTSADDLDFSDDEYHLSPAAIKSRLMEARRRPTLLSDVLYSEGEEVEGFVPDPRYSSDSPDNEWVTAGVDPEERLSPGFVVKQRNILTLEEAIYQFPPGVGVSPEEVEEVDDAENYWIVKERNLQTANFAEDAKEYIDAKIAHIEDYFKRLEKGQLNPSELKEMRPDNFDEPFYPTPQQLQFLNSLNIQVNWWLSDLHKYHLLNLSICEKSKAQWSDLKLFADTSRFTLREDKIIARNWFAFQKEYGFYDLRPLVSVRTARLVRQNGQLVVQLFEYMSHVNKVHFLLYLAKDLPTRTLKHVNRRIVKLLPFLRGRCLMRQSQRVTGSILAQLLYVTQLLGVDMVAAELLVGRALRSFYSRCFAVHIMLRDITLRVGPWRQEEDERFLRGLKEVLGVSSFVEAFKLRSIPWMAIFPYVRTRSIRYMRRRLIVLVSQEGVKEIPATTRELMAKFIRLLYDEKVDDFSNLDWEGMARQVGAANPIRLVWSFRKFYFNYIPYQHRITVPEGLSYMYKHLLPFYEGYDPRRIPQPGDPDYQEHQHTHSLDAANLSSNPSHDLPDASHDPRNLGVNSYDFTIEPSVASGMPDNSESNPHHDTESANHSVEPCNPRIDNRNFGQFIMTTSKTVGSSASKEDKTTQGDDRNKLIATSAQGDQRNKRRINHNHEKHPKNIKKVKTSDLFGPTSLRKVRSNTQEPKTSDLFGPTSLRKVRSNTQEPKTFQKVSSIHQKDVINLKKYFDRSKWPSSLSRHHHQYRGNPMACVTPSQHDENTFEFYNDSDNDGLTSSDSDVDDFELETLGQAVEKNLSYGRKSR